MNRLVPLIFLLVAVLLSSCSTTNYVSLESRYKSHFIGMSHHSIVTELGAPTRETTDGLDGTILIYESTSQKTEYSEKDYLFYTVPTATTTTHTDYIHLFIDSQGTCYDVKSNEIQEDKRIDILNTCLYIGVTIITCILILHD